MKTISAKEAKTHFGEFLDAMLREPVMVTKNNRPVGIMLSMEDAANALLLEQFLQKEPGYEAWFSKKVAATQAAQRSGLSKHHSDSEVMARAIERIKTKSQTNTTISRVV
jgi:prevent-host-death family protein